MLGLFTRSVKVVSLLVALRLLRATFGRVLVQRVMVDAEGCAG